MEDFLLLFSYRSFLLRNPVTLLFSSTLFVLLNNLHESEMDVNLFEKNIQLGKDSTGNLADMGIRKTYHLNSHEKYPINSRDEVMDRIGHFFVQSE